MGKMMLENPMNTIIFEQMGQRSCIGQIIDGNNFQMRMFAQKPKKSPTDPTQTINANFNPFHSKKSMGLVASL